MPARAQGLLAGRCACRGRRLRRHCHGGALRRGRRARSAASVAPGWQAGSGHERLAHDRTLRGGALSTRGGRVCARAGGTSARACTSFLSASGVSAAARIGTGTCGADWLPGCARGGSRDGEFAAGSAFGSGQRSSPRWAAAENGLARGLGLRGPLPARQELGRALDMGLEVAGRCGRLAAPARRTHHLGRDRLRAAGARCRTARAPTPRASAAQPQRGRSGLRAPGPSQGARERAFRRERPMAPPPAARSRPGPPRPPASAARPPGWGRTPRATCARKPCCAPPRSVPRPTRSSRTMLSSVSTYTRLTVANARLRQS